jgi:thiosulfate/3-mercaptopyruvate sulfurtransferase
LKLQKFMNSWKVLLSGLLLVMLLALAGCSGDSPTVAPKSSEETAKKITSDRADYYVDVDWLNQNLAQVMVVDARAEKDYKAGHIPGSINITWQSLSNMEPKQGQVGWGVVLPPDKLAAKIGQYGIDGSKPVVVYNDPAGMGEEGRVAWMLKIAGLADTRMLYGGWPAWKSSGQEISRELPGLAPVSFKISSPDHSRLATTAYIKSHQKTIKLVDTRSPEEFHGETNHGEKRKGHIPGAIHIHYQDTYSEDGYVKSIPELKAMFAKAGLQPEDDIVTYCTVGIRSGYMAEVLRMCGYEKAKNYNASFSEWCGDPANPVEK